MSAPQIPDVQEVLRLHMEAMAKCRRLMAQGKTREVRKIARQIEALEAQFRRGKVPGVARAGRK